MQRQDFSQEKDHQKPGIEDISRWQSTLQEIDNALVITNVRLINSSFINTCIIDLNNIHGKITKNKDINRYFHSINAFSENINDTLMDLNLALDVLERGEHDESITNYADSRRIFYHSLYRCRRYIEEALRQFKQ